MFVFAFAADAWGALVDLGALVFLRRVVREAVDDEEIVDSSNAVPDWLADLDGDAPPSDGDARPRE